MVSTSTGVAVLGTGLEPREFPQVEHPLLCKRKLTLCHHGVSDEHASLLSNRRVRTGFGESYKRNFYYAASVRTLGPAVGPVKLGPRPVWGEVMRQPDTTGS